MNGLQRINANRFWLIGKRHDDIGRRQPFAHIITFAANVSYALRQSKRITALTKIFMRHITFAVIIIHNNDVNIGKLFLQITQNINQPFLPIFITNDSRKNQPFFVFKLRIFCKGMAQPIHRRVVSIRITARIDTTVNTFNNFRL